MKTRGSLVTMFAVALSFAPRSRNVFCPADIAGGRTGPLPWAENQG